ncbi:hypothetical protein TNCV_3080311 [Trichonephila clavipes]|nr:hypothetical protein TNCV_3080311 [Trichonephila clavipes]
MTMTTKLPRPPKQKVEEHRSERVAVQNGRVAVASDFCISCKCGIPLNSDNTTMKSGEGPLTPAKGNGSFPSPWNVEWQVAGIRSFGYDGVKSCPSVANCIITVFF